MPMTTDWQVRREITAAADVTGEEPMRANALGHGLMFRPDVIHIEWRRMPARRHPAAVPDPQYTRVVTVRGPALNKDGTENKAGRRASRRYDDEDALGRAPLWVSEAVRRLRDGMANSTLLHFDGPTTFARHRPPADIEAEPWQDPQPPAHLSAEELAAFWERRARDRRRRLAAERGEDWWNVR